MTESTTRIVTKSWRDDFTNGVNAFRAQRYDAAAEHLSSAIRLGADRANVYDLRATVFDTLKRPKDALKDAKKVIQLAPNSYKGYMRAAQSFDAVGNYEAALLMTEQALLRVDESNPQHSEPRKTLLCQLETYQDHRRQTTCHVGVLPVEILALVFQHGSMRHDDDLMEDISPRSSMDNAFVKSTSHVCQHWREVVLGTPALWQSLVLGRGRLESKARAWSTRANGSIREMVILPPFSHDLATDTPLAVVLRKHLRKPPSILRLGQGQAFREAQCFRPWLLALFKEDDLKLRELVVSRDSQTAQAGQRMWRPLSWHGYPLVSLSLRGASIDWQEQEFKDLKSIVLRDAFHVTSSLNLVVHKLSQSPELEALVLAGNVPTTAFVPTPPHVPQVVEFTRLWYLELEGRAWDAEVFLGQIALPGLRILKLRNIKNPACKVLARLASSHPALTTLKQLHLQGCGFVPEDLIRALELSGQNLELLEISRTGVEVNGVIDALAGRRRPLKARGHVLQTTGRLCPNLTNLIFAQVSRLTGAPIKDLVKSKTQTSEAVSEAVPPLGTSNNTRGIKSLILEECVLVEPELVPWLKVRVPRVVCTYGNFKRQEARRILG
ncbi:hypothetical protein FRB98_009185 [Tulasnella sp. 332]|nr:hypothetical protein FRB98_009185 [Tulasnella sp. 332]